MKKMFAGILPLLVSAALFSCGGEPTGQCDGEVTAFTDTAFMLKIGEYDILVDTREATFTNGAAIAGDSVVVDYRGDLRKKRIKGLAVRVKPQQPRYFEPTDELLTAPASESQEAELEKFVEEAEKHGH